MNKKELTWRIRVYGIVQGVGFRPTVSRHATSNGICGTVCNKGPYVEIYARGQKKQMEGFHLFLLPLSIYFHIRSLMWKYMLRGKRNRWKDS